MNDNKVISENTVLNVENLCVDFTIRGRLIHVLSDISFSLERGKTLGVVGESGCGKSMTALALLRMVPSPPGRISSGKVVLNGEDLLKVSDKEIRARRGREISMIFQEPMTSLNPVYTIGNQIAETIRYHTNSNGAEAIEKTIELLRIVNIPAPERRISEYPYQLSGGLRQRVMIAMALACEPRVLIADEPTTALDVTVQAQIIELLNEIQNTRGTGIILITHDLGVVAELADRVNVMYAGYTVETGTVEEVINHARHPYTQGLLHCMPDIKVDSKKMRQLLPEIPGNVPDLLQPLKGCPFSPRCSLAGPQCRELPPIFDLGHGRSMRCWLAQETEWMDGND